MKKILFLRGPDGRFHEFHETPVHDEWNPLPGQDVQIQSALTGAGWFLVVSVRSVMTGSKGHSQVKLELEDKPTIVYSSHMEVYLEEKRLKVCESCGSTAMTIAKFCFNCGMLLPVQGVRHSQPPLAPRQNRGSR